MYNVRVSLRQRVPGDARNAIAAIFGSHAEAKHVFGPGMMRGYGPGVTGPGWNTGRQDLNLSTDNVKNYFDGWLAWQGNPRLKVGDVKEKDADTVVIDIVTEDNSLVQRFLVNRHNGYFQPSED